MGRGGEGDFGGRAREERRLHFREGLAPHGVAESAEELRTEEHLVEVGGVPEG